MAKRQSKIDRERKDAIRFVGWMREALGLEDWTIAVQVSADPPEEVADQIAQDQVIAQRKALGCCTPDAIYKTAKIWAQGTDLFPTLGHEMCHVLAADLELKNDTDDCFEFTWCRLGTVLVAAYEMSMSKGKPK